MTTGPNSAVAFEWSEQSDAEVIQQVLDGNTAMFELLMRRYNERVYRAARAIVRDEQEAEDVMQQAYINAYTHLRQFNGTAQFSTWLTRIAINESLARFAAGHVRAVRRRTIGCGANQSPQSLREPRASGIHQRAARTAGVGDRHAARWHARGFVLRDVEGLSTLEVAECLDVTEDVVKTRLSRARAALRRVMLERTGATTPEAFRFYRPRCDRVVAQVLFRIVPQLS